MNREQDSGYEPDSEPKMQQDTSTIDIDEAAAAEVVLEFKSEVGEGASKLAGEHIQPGAGDVFQTAFRWIMRLLKILFQRNSSKEDARDEDEDEVDQEAD